MIGSARPSPLQSCSLKFANSISPESVLCRQTELTEFSNLRFAGSLNGWGLWIRNEECKFMSLRCEKYIGVGLNETKRYNESKLISNTSCISMQ